jgi:hypothetical protein
MRCPYSAFDGPTLPVVLPEKQRTPTSGGKLVGVQVVRRGAKN